MPLDAAHEILRKQPLSKLGVDLACAVIDHHDGEDADKVVRALIRLARVMAEHMLPVKQTAVAIAMHEEAIALLPPEPKPMMHKNGKSFAFDVVK